MSAPFQESDQERQDAAALIALNQEQAALAATQDDDGAEHAAYLRGVGVGHLEGLRAGRGAVVAMLRSVLAKTPPGIASRIVAELITTIEAEGQTDPAGYERGRREAIIDAAACLLMKEQFALAGAAKLICDYERELRKAREAEKRERGGR